jgi:hypothetical protein
MNLHGLCCELIPASLILLLVSTWVTAAPPAYRIVELRPGTDRVEVWIGGALFTAYRYGPEFKLKPVYYPVLSPGGHAVNRELPYIRNSGESSDHPHHESLYFGYGDVNGLDFWSSGHQERVVHLAVLNQRNGETGLLETLAEWRTSGGEAVAREIRRVTFGAGPDVRWMDHDITLTALDRPLVFNDTKEGMFALRLADALREKGGTGRYLDAFGEQTAERIWGKRSPWVALQGVVEGEEVTVAIFDHPTTHNYPSYWHARDYGLFAVNPFGRKDFAPGSEPLNDRLAPHRSFHFRYRVAVYAGKVDRSRLAADYWAMIQ